MTRLGDWHATRREAGCCGLDKDVRVVFRPMARSGDGMKFRSLGCHRRIAQNSFGTVQCRCDEARIFIVLAAFLADIKHRVANQKL